MVAKAPPQGTGLGNPNTAHTKHWFGMRSSNQNWRCLTEEREETLGLGMILPRTFQPMCPLHFPGSPQGRALLCVADEEGVGCALAASVSGFFSSVAMAFRPTGQGRETWTGRLTAPNRRLTVGRAVC